MADGSPRVYHPDPCIAVYDAESPKGRDLAPGARRGQRVRCRGPVRPLSGICERCGAKRLQPQPGPQTEFLACSTDVALFGGAMGGGKTTALLLDWLRHANTPGANGLICRAVARDITIGGGLWDEAIKFYSGSGMWHRAGSNMDMKWPSGATLSFRHLADRDYERFKGPGFLWIGIEEVDECSLESILWLLGRNRSTCGAVPYLRATCNPNPDHPIAKWVDPYLYPIGHPLDGYPDRSKSGMILYMMRDADDRVAFGSTREEVAEKTGQPAEDAQTFAFIPSSYDDNQLLAEADPNYKKKFALMTRAERERNRGGNWRSRVNVKGMLRYQTRWGGILDQPLAQIVKRRRGWDKASTLPDKDSPDPDFTAGVRLEWDVDGRVYVSGLALCRDDPPEVDKLMAATASQDGPRVLQAIRQDPAQAGKVDLLHTSAVLRSSGRCGPIAVMKEIGDKPTKAKPLALAIELGLAGHEPRANGSPAPMIYILNRNNWTEQPYKDPSTPETTLLKMFEAQVIPFFNPAKSKKKDIVDAMATAYSAHDVPMPDEDTDVANAWAAYG